MVYCSDSSDGFFFVDYKILRDLEKGIKTMPPFLKKFIEQLSASQADQLWDWLDSNPDALDELIAAAYQNPNLKHHENTGFGPWSLHRSEEE